MKLEALEEVILDLQVSIPKRVSEALKQAMVMLLLLVGLVSIPKRVSEALKR